MKKEKTLAHEFVGFIPDVLKEGTLYVSIKYATVVHKCCCGCGKEVVTPLSPTDWKLIFDGKTISLDPSIGNWGFPCMSHYWIRGGKVKWAPRWSQKQIDAGRARDRFAKQRYFGMPAAADAMAKDEPGKSEMEKVDNGFWRRLRNWWS
jgi:Family of unknown function (DUF6527)